MEDFWTSDEHRHRDTGLLLLVWRSELRNPGQVWKTTDVIVVGKGRKCPRVSETPPNHAQSALRMLFEPQLSPQIPTSPPPAMEIDIRDPAVLEWYSPPGNRSSLHATRVKELRARLGYLEAEAQRNVELRAEIRQDFCKVFSEVCELREMINNLGKHQKCDLFRRHREEAKWNEFENMITTQIAVAKSHAIEHELQIRHESYDVIKKDVSTKWDQRLDRGERVK
jgi:hypothetical protein